LQAMGVALDAEIEMRKKLLALLFWALFFE